MPLDLISNLASLYYKDRLEELNEYSSNASDIQSEQMFDLLREAEFTEWGRKYDYTNIFSYQDFRERIPVSSYETIKPFILRMEKGESNLLWPGIPKKILSSFNGEKIPVSIQTIEETILQGVNDLYAVHLRDNPDTKLFGGYFLSVGNDGEKAFMDEINVLLRESEPFLFSLLNLPKKYEMRDMSEESIAQFIKEISTEKISCLKGSLQGLVNFIEKTKKYRDETNKNDFMSEAEVLFNKTTALSDTLESFKSSLLLPIPVISYYCSPEGFIGMQDNPKDSSYLLMLDLSTFYEFLLTSEPDKQPIPLEDVEPGEDYNLILTNCSGLWRYKSGGPKLRFVSKSPYRFLHGEGQRIICSGEAFFQRAKSTAFFFSDWPSSSRVLFNRSSMFRPDNIP